MVVAAARWLRARAQQGYVRSWRRGSGQIGRAPRPPVCQPVAGARVLQTGGRHVQRDRCARSTANGGRRTQDPLGSLGPLCASVGVSMQCSERSRACRFGVRVVARSPRVGHVRCALGSWHPVRCVSQRQAQSRSEASYRGYGGDVGVCTCSYTFHTPTRPTRPAPSYGLGVTLSKALRATRPPKRQGRVPRGPFVSMYIGRIHIE